MRRLRSIWVPTTLLAAVSLLLGLGAPGAAAKAKPLKLTIGYSAWPGWFPLAVAQKEGIFKKAGLSVKLKYFVDYTASLDALVAGKLDVNAQTLNDTIYAVASGAKQRVIVVNDNSTGNDEIICDKSIGSSIKDLKGKTIGAEAGVVDHFLLLQGLAKEGMTEKDIDFRGIKTDAAASAFQGGQFDCVGVFAPFTVQALKRAGSHAVFTSADFPGVIPDHFVATAKAAKSKKAMQRLVNAWYMTLDWIAGHHDAAVKVMAAKAGVSVAEYEDFAKGTTLFTPEQAVHAFEDRPGDPTSLAEMARRTNPFLVSSGLTKEAANLKGLLVSRYTKAYVKAHS